MDTNDNFPQKFNAEILIRANSDAEAQRLRNLEQQSRENDACIQEMRRLNSRNTEVMDRVEGVLGQMNAEGAGSDARQREILIKLDEVLNALNTADAGPDVTAKLEEISAALSANTQSANDFIHSENVKVYRNVQASIKEELEKNNKVLSTAQTEKFTEALENLEIDTSSGVQTATLVFSVLAFVASLGGVIFQLLTHFGIIY